MESVKISREKLTEAAKKSKEGLTKTMKICREKLMEARKMSKEGLMEAMKTRRKRLIEARMISKEGLSGKMNEEDLMGVLVNLMRYQKKKATKATTLSAFRKVNALKSLRSQLQERLTLSTVPLSFSKS
jgi:hypothetical protein